MVGIFSTVNEIIMAENELKTHIYRERESEIGKEKGTLIV